MKRSYDSARSIKWIKRNSLNYQKCKEYVSGLCKIQFNFMDFKFNLYQDDEEALWITYGLYSYVVFLSHEDIAIKVLEKSKEKKNGKDNYYHELRIFTGDSCWFNCLYWIKNR